MTKKSNQSSKRNTSSRRHSSTTSKGIKKKNRKISPERQMDILGVALIILGVISLFGFIDTTGGRLTTGVVRILGWIAGLGALIFPIMVMLVGLWFILRNERRFPVISIERLLGVLFLYINVLAWLHWFNGGGWTLANEGGGGGYIGAFFERVLVIALGDWGALVVLIAWMLVALAFTFDLSIPDLFRRLSRPAAKTGEFIAEKSATIAKPLMNKVADSPDSKVKERVYFPKKSEEPTGFTPLKTFNGKASQDHSQTHKVSETTAKPMVTEARMSRIYASSKNSINWKLPLANEILNPPSKVVVRKNVDQERAHIIEETLASLGAPAHVVEIHRGPTFTQYGVEPDFIETRSGKTRVRVNKIASLADDLALALAAPSIRIQAPVPGRHYIGIEVPNSELELVSLKEAIESQAFTSKNAFLKFVLGKDVSGKPVVVDLTQMPHLLIAGTTGSGKSVCINSILCSFLMQRTPNELRLVLVDPKRVELTGYNGIPHLLTPVVVDPEKVIGTLQWMSREMDIRYKKFAEVGARSIVDYNAQSEEKLPFIVLVIDELADLMMIAPEETEGNLKRLAQLARATGIHVIIATQRPSVDIITGMIKANFPARISFTVASGVDSRVVLDQPGAERLIGKGDMLFQSPDASAPKRIQGVFISNEEINRLIAFWKQQVEEIIANNPDGRDQLPQKVFPQANTSQTPFINQNLTNIKNEDPMLQEAIRIVRKEERASISMLQRKLRIGYTRAARLIDRMEELEIIGVPEDGSGVRPVIDFGDEEEKG